MMDFLDDKNLELYGIIQYCAAKPGIYRYIISTSTDAMLFYIGAHSMQITLNSSLHDSVLSLIYRPIRSQFPYKQQAMMPKRIIYNNNY